MPGNYIFLDLITVGLSGALNLCLEYRNPNLFTGSDSPRLYGTDMVNFDTRGLDSEYDYEEHRHG